MTAKHERHSTQARRATKKLKEIRVVIGWDGYQRSLPYNDNCQQYRRALQAGSGE